MRKFSIALLCVLGALMGGAFAQLAADMKLEDAGFVMRPANTAKELDHIKRLPPRRFVARVKNGQRYYLYADPELCQCVFLGDSIALQAYRDMRKRLPQPDNVSPAGVVPQAELVEDMNRDLSDVIDDGNILDWKF